MEVRLRTNEETPSGVTVWLEYNASTMTFVGGETNDGDFDNPVLTVDPEAAGDGKVQFFAFSSTPLMEDDYLVGTLTFAANTAGTSDLNFLVEPGEETLVMDALLNEMEATLTGGSVTITEPGATPTPTPTPVEGDLFILF